MEHIAKRKQNGNDVEQRTAVICYWCKPELDVTLLTDLHNVININSVNK